MQPGLVASGIGLRTSLTVPVLHGPKLLAVLSLERARAVPPERRRAGGAGELSGPGGGGDQERRRSTLRSAGARSSFSRSSITRRPRSRSGTATAGMLLTNRRWLEMFLLGRRTGPGWPGRPDGRGAVSRRARAEPPRARPGRAGAGQTIEYEVTHQIGREVRTYLSVKFPLVDAGGAAVRGLLDLDGRHRAEALGGRDRRPRSPRSAPRTSSSSG